jgi:hypothetical protein
LPTGLSGLATDDEAQTSDEVANGANSFGSDRGIDGRSSGSDTDLRVVCIYNNNNSAGEKEDKDPCKCFAAISEDLRNAINAWLSDDEANEIGDTLIEANNIKEFCKFLNKDPVTASSAELEDFIREIADAGGIGMEDVLEAEAQALVDCLIEEKLIIE